MSDREGFTNPAGADHERARQAQVVDLLADNSWLNVYAGKLEVRPPGAPITEALHESENATV
jgi:hypothetical protein